MPRIDNGDSWQIISYRQAERLLSQRLIVVCTNQIEPPANCGCVYHAEQGIPCPHDYERAKKEGKCVQGTYHLAGDTRWSDIDAALRDINKEVQV